MSLLKRLFSGSAKPSSAPFTAPIAPQTGFYAVGDVHGCMHLLPPLLDRIRTAGDSDPIVFVGDYIDRGEESAAVLRHLFALKDDPRIVCLPGNHEEMMLKFIADPEAHGSRWLRYGGLQTMASFGVGGITPSSGGEALVGAAARLEEAIGADLLAWIRDLPLYWQSGNVAVVHAGADPALPIAEQAEQTLKWGHPDFDRVTRTDGTWVVHGHTIVDQAHAEAGRIAVDTGAYASGRLTAARITPGDVQFIAG